MVFEKCSRCVACKILIQAMSLEHVKIDILAQDIKLDNVLGRARWRSQTLVCNREMERLIIAIDVFMFCRFLYCLHLSVSQWPQSDK